MSELKRMKRWLRYPWWEDKPWQGDTDIPPLLTEEEIIETELKRPVRCNCGLSFLRGVPQTEFTEKEWEVFEKFYHKFGIQI